MNDPTGEITLDEGVEELENEIAVLDDPPVETDPPEGKEGEGDDEPVKEGEGSDEDPPEGEGDDPPGGSGEGDEGDNVGAFDELEKVSELAEGLGVEQDKLLDLKLQVPAAGEDTEVSLRDLVARYQEDFDYTKKTEEVAALRKSAQSQFDAFRIEAGEELSVTDQLLNGMMETVKTKRESQEQQDLRHNDAAEWSAQQTEMNQEEQRINGLRGQAITHYNDTVQQGKDAYYELQASALTDLGIEPKSQVVLESVKRIYGRGFEKDKVIFPVDARLIKMDMEMNDLRKERDQLKATAEKTKNLTLRLKRNAPAIEKPGKTGGQAGSGKETEPGTGGAATVDELAELGD